MSSKCLIIVVSDRLIKATNVKWKLRKNQTIIIIFFSFVVENQKRIKRQKILKEQKQKCKFAFNYAATDDNNDDDEIPPRLKY